MVINPEDISIAEFPRLFARIMEMKSAAGITGLLVNPPDLFERAQLYGTRYSNGSWGWASNIWNRSAAGSVVVNSEAELQPEHKQLMLAVLEQSLCRPMLQVDANLGQPGSKAEMKSRLFLDVQFPDIGYRWSQLNFPGSAQPDPDAVIYYIPQYLENPNLPGSQEMLKVIRFPHSRYSIVTCSSYQGECKKGFLSHWIHHVYTRGGCGEHASLKEFTIKTTAGMSKRVVMCCWGLTGSGKSTHGLYIVDDVTAPLFQQHFGVDMGSLVSHQVLKNDDIVGVFADQVVSPERGSWTKTEDVTPDQPAMYKAGMSPRALHENTEFDASGNVSFAGALYQYHGKPNQNARTVFYLEDTGYYDGNVNSTQPLNMAVFISPGYISDFAWLKIADPLFAAKVLADGRTVGHPAQSRVGVGKEKFEARYCHPFTMGTGNAAHVERFYHFLQERQEQGYPIEVYQISTTGRVGTEYEWVEEKLGDDLVRLPKTKFETINGKIKPVGGTGPSILETELFLMQAARGAVRYEPHPLWGDKVLVPVAIEGLSAERIRALNPFTYRSVEEMKQLLRAQILASKYYLARQSPGLPAGILQAMDL